MQYRLWRSKVLIEWGCHVNRWSGLSRTRSNCCESLGLSEIFATNISLNSNRAIARSLKHWTFATGTPEMGYGLLLTFAGMTARNRPCTCRSAKKVQTTRSAMRASLAHFIPQTHSRWHVSLRSQKCSKCRVIQARASFTVTGHRGKSLTQSSNPSRRSVLWASSSSYPTPEKDQVGYRPNNETAIVAERVYQAQSCSRSN